MSSHLLHYLLLPPTSLPEPLGRPTKALRLILSTHTRLQLRFRPRPKWLPHDDHPARTRTRSGHRTRTRVHVSWLVLVPKYPTARFLVLGLTLCERAPWRRGRRPRAWARGRSRRGRAERCRGPCTRIIINASVRSRWSFQNTKRRLKRCGRRRRQTPTRARSRNDELRHRRSLVPASDG